MAAPELTTFASLIRYALEMEDASARFYEALAGQTADAALKEAAGLLAKDHRERRKVLERARQQYLNEVILEPITGLDGRTYVIDASPPSPEEVGEKALLLEETAGRFYSDSAAVAEALLAEAARTFRKLAEGNARNVTRVRGLRAVGTWGPGGGRP